MAFKAVNKFLFDLDFIERNNVLRQVVEKTIALQKAHNLPVVYRNNLCTTPNQFIHEYPDGRKFLIYQNPNTSDEKVIKQL